MKNILLYSLILFSSIVQAQVDTFPLSNSEYSYKYQHYGNDLEIFRIFSSKDTVINDTSYSIFFIEPNHYNLPKALLRKDENVSKYYARYIQNQYGFEVITKDLLLYDMTIGVDSTFTPLIDFDLEYPSCLSEVNIIPCMDTLLFSLSLYGAEGISIEIRGLTGPIDNFFPWPHYTRNNLELFGPCCVKQNDNVVYTELCIHDEEHCNELVSIDELNDKSFAISVTIDGDLLYGHSGSDIIKEIYIYSIDGQMRDSNVGGNINIQDFSTGIYLVQFRLENTMITEKVFIP